MKNLLKLLVALLIPIVAIADGTAWNGPVPLGNYKWLSSRSGSTFVDLDILRMNSSGDTEINVPVSGRSLLFQVNKTTEFTLADNLISLSGVPATIQGAGGLRLNPDADAQRLFTFDASSDTALTATWGDGGTTAVQILTVSASTADADDDSSLVLAGGGAAGGTRGASITLPGEEVAGGSDITYNAGTGDTHIFQVAGVTGLTVSDTTATFVGTLTSTRTTDVGWAIVDSTNNTACNSICTSACVFGFGLTTDTALPITSWDSCATATSDICLCAGAS